VCRKQKIILIVCGFALAILIGLLMMIPRYEYVDSIIMKGREGVVLTHHYSLGEAISLPHPLARIVAVFICAFSGIGLAVVEIFKK